jgi:hypothetical protein
MSRFVKDLITIPKSKGFAKAPGRAGAHRRRRRSALRVRRRPVDRDRPASAHARRLEKPMPEAERAGQSLDEAAPSLPEGARAVSESPRERTSDPRARSCVRSASGTALFRRPWFVDTCLGKMSSGRVLRDGRALEGHGLNRGWSIGGIKAQLTGPPFSALPAPPPRHSLLPVSLAVSSGVVDPSPAATRRRAPFFTSSRTARDPPSSLDVRRLTPISC